MRTIWSSLGLGAISLSSLFCEGQALLLCQVVLSKLAGHLTQCRHKQSPGLCTGHIWQEYSKVCGCPFGFYVMSSLREGTGPDFSSALRMVW